MRLAYTQDVHQLDSPKNNFLNSGQYLEFKCYVSPHVSVKIIILSPLALF